MIIAATLLRFVLAGVLLLASVAKFPRIGEFEEAVRRFGVVPPRFRGAFARIVPGVELVLAVALFAGIGLRLVSFASGVLFLVFNGVVALNLARGGSFDCGCGGVGGPSQIGIPLLLRNFALVGACLFVAIVVPGSLVALHDSQLTATSTFALFALAILAVLAVQIAQSLIGLRAARFGRAV
jgi:uncharacterized membrane protein YphA (DoxX/SURF4 family)